ncbi:hypothetical protein [Blastococcus capsensis]|uniref:hypothetical protein n=1 Tax=Blastococcus capsensis TaxID=1564163 RepID=UPI002541B480|nr:hypothetical protein [Blastococcus capsensis]MDK3257143.1 hypothetical protein [Blastococcus capsensis]
MISRISTAVAERGTAAKLVGTLGVLAAAATVAGLGTYGDFTTTEPVDARVDAGGLSIELDVTAGGTTVPFSSASMLPGDAERVPLDLANDGEAPLSSVTFSSVAATLAPGGVDHLPATISFPGTADEDLVGQASRIAFTFAATQRDGVAR